MTTMKCLFKINRKKSPKPPHQPISPEKTADIAAGPRDLRAELDVTSPGDGGQNVSDDDLEVDHTDQSCPSWVEWPHKYPGYVFEPAVILFISLEMRPSDGRN